MKKHKMALKDEIQWAYRTYKHLGGEVEARNVQNRMHMSEHERRNTLLANTESYDQSGSFITDEQLEKYDQLMWHGTPNILGNNRFDLKYLGTGEGEQAFGYGAYLAQNRKVAENYTLDGEQYFKLKDGREISATDLRDTIKTDIEYGWLPLDKIKYFNSTKIADDLMKNTGKHWAIQLAVIDDFVKDFEKKANYPFGDKLRNALEKYIPVETFTQKGNLYSVDGPEDFELLDWDATMKEQPEQVLNKLRNSGFKIHDDETGSDLYRRLSKKFGGGKNGDKKASMWLNDLGIPGHRFFDGFSRDKKDGTHNFVIWNTDTLKVLGLEGDNYAEDYYKAEDYYNSKLDALDNDSDVVDYSNADYENESRRADNYYNSYLDGLDNEPNTGESYNQSAHENKFMTPDALERYDQLRTHATGNIIWGNRFDLKFVGSSEGGAAYGYGAYFEESPKVAESYRTFGLPDNGWGTLKVSTSDGEIYRKIGGKGWDYDDSTSNELKEVLRRIDRYFDSGENIPAEKIKSELREQFDTALERFSKMGTSGSSGVYVKEIRKSIKKQIAILDRISQIDFQPSTKKGNIYTFDIPEDYELLDWDAPLSQQPEKVKKAIKKIVAALERRGYSKQDVLKNPDDYNVMVNEYDRHTETTGGDFYENVVACMEDWLKYYPKPKDGITRADARASFLLNKFGIPGHRFWDRQSRTLQEGTHNYVIWNMEKIKMVGISPDSDTDAIRIFNDKGRRQLEMFDDESYNQSANDRQIYTDSFKKFFGDWQNDPEHASKFVDDNGMPLIMYHGTGRADRVGSIFRPDRATSGPMAFFTSLREMGEGYARDKADTSLSRENLRNYRDQFTIELKGKKINISEYWDKLTAAQKNKIAQVAPSIGYDYDNDEEIKIIAGNTEGSGGYDVNLRQANGNHLEALVNEWLNSGNLYGEEEKFLDILRMVGIDNVEYANPNYREEKVYAVYLSIKTPLITTEISDKVFNALKRAALKAEKTFDPDKAYNADLWDKTNISPLDWIGKLEEDRKNGTTRAWTIIPDWVTDTLKKLGYDGIKDLGGKYSGAEHIVGIPFYSEQIKSATENNGDFDTNNPDIYYQPANLQDNPFIERYSQTYTFDNPETEKAFKKSREQETPKGKLAEIQHSMTQSIKGLRGDYPELATKAAKAKGLVYAREVLRKMGRVEDAKTWLAVQSLSKSLKHLDADKLDAFTRLMLINDIYNFKRYNPKAKLPMNFTPESLKSEREKFTRIAQNNPAIMEAVRLEHEAHEAIKQELSGLAEELGMKKFADKVKRYDYYILDYARLLGGKGINANYIQAAGEFRTAQLKDIEHLQAIKALKGSYDKKDELIKKFGKDWRKHIPKGYTVFNPLKEQFVTSAHTLTENILGMALEQAGQDKNGDFLKKR